jgi:hypothetical protein
MFHFHEETLSWQRELSPLSSATSVSGQTLAAIGLRFSKTNFAEFGKAKFLF